MSLFIRRQTGLVTFFLLGISITVSAQQYRTAADTPALNKKYASLSLDMAKLQSRLVEAQNKTAQYQKQTDQAKIDASASAQSSMNKAQTATSGNTDDTRRAVKEAKLADRRARAAKKADEKEKENQENISRITDEISKKQVLLTSLETQKSAILGNTPAQSGLRQDSSSQSVMTPDSAR